jgi:hypothetical protein
VQHVPERLKQFLYRTRREDDRQQNYAVLRHRRSRYAMAMIRDWLGAFPAPSNQREIMRHGAKKLTGDNVPDRWTVEIVYRDRHRRPLRSRNWKISKSASSLAGIGSPSR